MAARTPWPAWWPADGNGTLAIPPGPETRAAALAFNNMADEVQQLLLSLNESEATFRRLFEDAHDPVMLVQKGRIIACNLAALMQLGFHSRQELLNHTFADISPRFQPDGRFSSEKAAEIMVATEQVGHQRFDACAVQ